MITRRLVLCLTYFFCLSLLLLVNRVVFAQMPEWVWANQANGQLTTTRNVIGDEIATDSLGNSYVAGWYQAPSATFDSITITTASTIANLFVAKYDPDGKALWVVQTTSCRYSYGLGIALDNSNHVYVTGYYSNITGTCSFGPYTFQNNTGTHTTILAQLNVMDGSVNWVKESVGSGQGNGVSVYGNNEIYVTGSVNNDFFLSKYDMAGNILWNRVVASNLRQAYGTAVANDASGNVIVTGNYNSTVTFGSTTLTGGTVFAAKYNSVGTLLWAKSFVGSNYNYNSSTTIDTDADGNIVIGGFYINTFGIGGYSITNTSGNYMNFIAKLDPSGNALWVKDAGVEYNNTGVSPDLVITDDRQIIFAGTYTLGYANSAMVQDIFVMKFDAAGNKIWHLHAGGTAYDLASSVSKDGRGNYYITGFSQSAQDTFGTIVLQNASGWSEFIIAKISETGDSLVADFTASGTTICAGTAITFTDQSLGSPASWEWNFPGGTPPNSNTQITTVTYNNPGSYSVKLVVRNSSGGDSITEVNYITVLPSPDAGTVTATPDTVCTGGSAQLNATGTLGSIQWQSSGDGIDFTDIPGDTISSVLVTNLNQSIYYRVKSNGSCGVDSSIPVKLTVLPMPVVQLSSDDSIFCSGDSILICVVEEGTYLWNTGESSNCIIVKNAGAYWLTVTDNNGCTALSDRKNISVYPVPSVSIVVQGDTLSSFNAVTYQWYRNDTLIPWATLPVYTAPSTGEYSVQITDSNGCSATSSSVYILKTGVVAIGADVELRIYPNPFTERVYIAAENLRQIVVYDVLGKLLFEQKMESAINETPIELSDLEPSVYFLKIHTAHKAYLRKIIKQ